MVKPNLFFAIDISGIPPKNTCIGCVCINLKVLSKFEKEFNIRFKKNIHKKGRQLDYFQLEQIMSFFDEYQIRSCSTVYNTQIWDGALRLVPKNKAYKIEKILGIVYFLLLNEYSRSNNSYLVHICEESQLKINVIRSACRELGGANNILYNITVGNDRQDFAIKMADYVASATRKIKFDKLKKCRYFRYTKAHLSDEHIRKVFDLI